MNNDKPPSPSVGMETLEIVPCNCMHPGSLGGDCDGSCTETGKPGFVYRQPSPPATEQQRTETGWEPISTRPDCNDPMWFARLGDRSVDGPREPRHDDADWWDVWCYASYPPLPPSPAGQAKP